LTSLLYRWRNWKQIWRVNRSVFSSSSCARCSNGSPRRGNQQESYWTILGYGHLKTYIDALQIHRMDHHVCDSLSYSNHESAKRCCEQCPRTIRRSQLDGGVGVPDTSESRRSARVLHIHHDAVTIIRSTETRKGDYPVML
jgi:hypothetical protein